MRSIRNSNVFKGIAILLAALAIKQLARIKRTGRLKLSGHSFPQAPQPLK